MGNLLGRVITFFVIYISAGVAINTTGLRSLIWLFIFVFALNVYTDFAVRKAHRKDFPFHWLCPQCKAKRKRFFAEATNEYALVQLVFAHNRATHLEER